MKIAICLRGAISKIGTNYFLSKNLDIVSPYVNYNSCYNSIIKHIVEFNKFCHFDFYIHSWNIDLQSNLIKLYNPKKYLFEQNSNYFDEINKKCQNEQDFGGISASLSLQKSINLLDDNYDLVIIYRPDLLLIKDLDLSKYDTNKIYVNGGFGEAGWTGDFHFIMNQINAKKFSLLYNSIEQGNKHEHHYWINKYVNKFMNDQLIIDDITMGKNQEVLRKINATMVKINNIPIDKLLEYGLTQEEIKQYNG